MQKAKFGQMIREQRLKKGMTQKDLALALGYDSPQFVSILERDGSKVPLKTLGALIVILGLEEEQIVSLLLESYRNQVVGEIELGKKRSHAK